MLSLEDCIALSGLAEDENYLSRSADGRLAIKSMIRDVSEQRRLD